MLGWTSVSIYFLSTMHVAESYSAHPTVKRRRLDGAQEGVACCPAVLLDYQAYVRINFRPTTTLVCNQRSGGRGYFICRMCHFEQLYFGWAHTKCWTQFRHELAHELIGGFSSWKITGLPRSMEHECLNSLLGYWPVHVDKKRNCVVWAELQLFRRNSYLTQETIMSHAFSVHILKFTYVWLLDEKQIPHTCRLFSVTMHKVYFIILMLTWHQPQFWTAYRSQKKKKN